MPTSPSDRFRPSPGVALKITVVITLVLAFGIGVNLFLSYINFTTSYRKLVQSQFNVIGSGLKHTVETGLNLGLELDELRNIQELLQEIRSRHPELTVAAVAGTDGIILFDSDQTRIGSSQPEGWRRAALNGSEGPWQAESGTDMVQGLPLFNSFHKRVGTLVIGFPVTLVKEVAQQVAHELLQDFFVILAVAFLLTAILVRLNAGSLLVVLHRMSAALAAPPPGTAPAAGAPAPGCTPLETDFIAFHSTARQVEDALVEIQFAAAQSPRGGDDSRNGGEWPQG